MSAPRVWLCLALITGAWGCGDRSTQQERPADSRISSAVLATSIRNVVAAGRTEPGCARPSPSSPPTAIIAVTSEHCLNCLDIGGLLRGAERDSKRDGLDLRVVIRKGESDEVCAFLKREKVRLPVILVPPEGFPGGEELGEVVYVEFGPGLQVQRVLAAATGPQLLSTIRGSEQPPSIPARTESR